MLVPHFPPSSAGEAGGDGEEVAADFMQGGQEMLLVTAVSHRPQEDLQEQIPYQSLA